MDNSLVLKTLAYYGLLNTHMGDFSYTKHLRILCPWHAERNPDCGVDLQTGSHLCFACGHRGKDLTDFILAIEEERGYPWSDGIEMTIFDAAILKNHIATLPLEIQTQIYTDPFSLEDSRQKRRLAKFFFQSLPQPQWDLVRHNYMLDERGFDAETLRFFDVRINNTSSWPVIVPIYQQWKFAGYVTRRIQPGEPKYLNSEGMRKASILSGNILPGQVLLVEGKFDEMRSFQYGWENVCSTFGWHCSDTQFRKLADVATTIICAYDNDEKGWEGYERILKLASEKKIPVRRFIFPHNSKDLCNLTAAEFRTSLYLL